MNEEQGLQEEDQVPRESGTGNNARAYLLHGSLFLLTFVTATLAGVQWLTKEPYELGNFSSGMTYGVLILLMLGSHEFGHYFAARHHGVRTTLPYFLPLLPTLPFGIFGTLGAIIRVRSRILSRRVLFDIGAAGPIAGFIVSLLILIIGFITLPPKEYLYLIHPEYARMAVIPEGGFRFGETLLYVITGSLFAPSGAFIPPMNEIYHYPFLCIGWFGLFVTSLNLLPIGQLDGGHISYAMFGSRANVIGWTSLALLFILGLGGLLPFVGIHLMLGWPGWLLIASIHIFMLFGLKLGHSPLPDDQPLSPGRMTVGWICYGIFLLSFSIAPITISSADLLF